MGGAAKRVKRAARQLTKGVGTVVETVIEDPVKRSAKKALILLLALQMKNAERCLVKCLT